MSSRVYVGNLPVGITERELDDEFARFGRLRSVWVARKPPGFAFVEFEDPRDASDACRKLDGVRGWRVEVSTRARSGPNPRPERGPERGYGAPRGRFDDGYGRPRYRSRSPPRRRSYSRSRSPPRRSPSPRRRSPSPHDPSPPRD